VKFTNPAEGCACYPLIKKCDSALINILERLKKAPGHSGTFGRSLRGQRTT